MASNTGGEATGQGVSDALRESQERYQALFESIEYGFCLLQLLFDADDRPTDYRFLETNSAFEEHTGLRGAVGKTARELVPDLDESWFRLYGQVALTGETARFENQAPALGGRWFEVNASRVGRPELRQVALVFKNITERKTAEAERERLIAELDAAHRRLSGLLKHAPAFVATLRGPEHVFELVNRPYEELVGNRQLVGLRVLDALPETASQGFLDVLDNVYRTGEPFTGQETLVRLARGPDGALRDTYVNFVYQPRRNAQGEIEGIDAFGFDVTGQVEARRRVEVLAEELRQRADFEEKLIGIVSHDLRNPIGAILVGTSALLRADALDDRQTRAVVRIQSAADRAHRMIRDLLDFTQARLGGGIRLQRQEVDLRALLPAATEEVEAAHPGRTILTQLEGELRCSWDPDRLVQVVQNLLTNALKYGDQAAPVRLRARAESGTVMIAVHNEGDPIPPERRSELFQPLQRAAQKNDATGRSIGLGLYIVRQVVEAHGGTVHLESTAERGTTFTVSLSCGASSAQAPHPAEG